MQPKSYLVPVPPPSVAIGMELDPYEFAKALERLRVISGESQEKAATRVGVSLRQYSRWATLDLDDDERPTPRLSSVAKVAEAYGIDVTELLQEVTKGKGSLTDRLDRLERDIAHIRRALAVLIPAYAAAEAELELDQAAQSTAKTPDASPSRSAVA